MSTTTNYPLRTYPMQPGALTEEQIAVIFAMTSRRPEPFDEIREIVSAEKAADFNERWVLNYGHSSVAEHAIVHMAVENLSRLACDTLEDNRLASYTEKSSRYQLLPPGYFHRPAELDSTPELASKFNEICSKLFQNYELIVEGLREHLQSIYAQGPEERDSTYRLRLRREATDSARFVLPTSTLTNVGVTINARSLEHAIRKLLSSDLMEERLLGNALKAEGLRVTPTLIKYANANEYLKATTSAQKDASSPFTKSIPSGNKATLLHTDPDAERKVAAAFLFRYANVPYETVWQYTCSLSPKEMEETIDKALGDKLGPHDTPIRELESAYLTFEFILDYGAYREFKRHRMQTYIAQPATVDLGYVTPPLIEASGLTEMFENSMNLSVKGFEAVRDMFPGVEQYLVTHAHKRRVIATMNLRECYHLFKLRTQTTAHFSLVEIMQRALDEAKDTHPLLFKYLRQRD